MIRFPGKSEDNFLAEFFPDQNIYFYSSGTASLYYLLKALKSAYDKDEVVIPGYACPTIAAAIIRAGLKSILCDQNIHDFGLESEDLKRKLSANTLAVIQVDLFGILPQNQKISEIIKDSGCVFIGDIAQSLGNYLRYPNLVEQRQYDYLIMSFGRGKPLNLLHGGGIVALSSSGINIDQISGNVKRSPFLKQVKVFINIFLFKIFFNPYLYNLPRSLPFLHLGDTVFSLHFDTSNMISYVKRLAGRVIKKYNDIHTTQNLKIVKYRQLLKPYKSLFVDINLNSDNSYIRYPILFKNQDIKNTALTELNRAGIGATGLYPYSLDQQPGLEAYNLQSCKNSHFISSRILTLPVHENVNCSDFLKIEHIFSSLYNKIHP